MKIIFLDVDGVLNGYGLGTEIVFRISDFFHIKPGTIRRFYNPFGVDYFRVRKLAHIVHHTGAKVVMSSSWRGLFFDNTYHGKNIDKLKALFKEFNINCIDRTPHSRSGHRGKEIKQWLDNTNEIIESFVILDDEEFDIKDYFPNNLVKTSETRPGQMITGNWRERTGLQTKHVTKAINILNKK